MSMTTPRLVTAEEMLDRRGSWELVRGEVRDMTPGGWEHGTCGGTLSVRLGSYVLDRGLGKISMAETGFLVSRAPDTVRAPDLAFVSKARLPTERVTGWGTVIPDLVVEVVSPSDRATEVREKVEDWLRAGVRLVWVVYPSVRTVDVYRPGSDVRVLGEADVLEGEDVVPGFSLPVRQIFA